MTAQIGTRASAGLLLAGLLGCTALAAAPRPAEGLRVEGRHTLEITATRTRIDFNLFGEAASPAAAVATARAASEQLLESLRGAGLAIDMAHYIDTPPSPLLGDSGPPQRWRAVREGRWIVPTNRSSDALEILAARTDVRVLSTMGEHPDLVRVQQQAIEQATDDAARKGESAARRLGFTLGAVREVRVKQSERHTPTMLRAEATVEVRYTLLPATTRNEVLAIASAQQPRTVPDPPAAPNPAASPGPPEAHTAEPAGNDPRPADPSTGLAVEIIAAVYDSNGRGRFTTVTGTVWREIVPTPVQQRLRNGKRYTGTITLGIFGGYRMQLGGIPRELKVEPVGKR